MKKLREFSILVLLTFTVIIPFSSAHQLSEYADYWRAGTSNKHFEMSEGYDNASSHTAENFDSLVSYIDDGDLSALASGEITNSKGMEKYKQ